jgi:hypothetical protein
MGRGKDEDEPKQKDDTTMMTGLHNIGSSRDGLGVERTNGQVLV